MHSMYYVALLCPQEIDKKVLEYKRWMKDHFGCTAALKSPAHITLIPPFWLDEEKEATLHQTIKTFTSDIGSLQIELINFSHFNKRTLYVLVKDQPDLEKLKQQAESHFIRSLPGIVKKSDRPFHPHITIATRDLKPSDFIKSWEHFSKVMFTETFFAQSISLLKLGKGNWKVIEQLKW